MRHFKTTGHAHRTSAGFVARLLQSFGLAIMTITLVSNNAVAEFVWQTPWMVTIDEPFGAATAAFGASATTNGQIADVGQSGDLGHATAVARVATEGRPGGRDEDFIYSSAYMHFWRQFEISGAPAGWEVTLTSLLAGSIYASSWDRWHAAAGVGGDAGIYPEGGAGIDTATHYLEFQYGRISTAGTTPQQLDITRPDTLRRVIPDGIYIVAARISSGASFEYDWEPPFGGGNDNLSATSDFFDLPAWTITVDAAPFIPSLPPGDFNADGTVDAADYVVLRKGLVTGTYTQDDYTIWRANFAATAAGAAADAQPMVQFAVPEPTALALAALALVLLVLRRI